MEVKKGKTAKYLRGIRPVSQEVKDQLKSFTKTKKMLLNALKDGEKTIPQLSEVLNIPKDEIVFQLMSMLKYGWVETGEIDDADEYFYYRIKDDGKNKS